MTDNVTERKRYTWIIALLCYLCISTTILMVKDRDWRGEDITIFYALFASASFLVIGASVSIFAGLLGGWVLKKLSKSDWFMTNDMSTKGLIKEFVAIVLGLAMAGTVLWFFKDIKVSHDHYEAEWPSDPFLQ